MSHIPLIVCRTLSILQDLYAWLQDHLLARLLNKAYDGDKHNFDDEERGVVHIINDSLYLHKTLQINYTTYDVRHDQDTVNPHTHANVMVLSHKDDMNSEETSW